MAKNPIYNKLIHTNKWLMLRKKVLTKHRLCQVCEAQGRITLATEVHHIKPVQTAVGRQAMSALMFDEHNLLALCHDCHIKEHIAMGRGGKEARAKRNKEQLNAIVEKFLK